MKGKTEDGVVMIDAARLVLHMKEVIEMWTMAALGACDWLAATFGGGTYPNSRRTSS